ncbi:hypothetical protein L6452_21523 [Arctium lappa]|uniref:Uncharacterized protein n=1 Tax=Arctium lappa TaxID=4217 RepID=A0ACB9AXI8_ARCLA|nr:hypothetical protein L6452_21523 [Arctium lappa]
MHKLLRARLATININNNLFALLVWFPHFFFFFSPLIIIVNRFYYMRFSLIHLLISTSLISSLEFNYRDRLNGNSRWT